MKGNELREKLGLTQAQLAQYLSVSHSQLAMYEVGQRELPAAASLKLVEMESYVLRPPVKKNKNHAYIKTQQAKALQLLEKHAKELEYKEAGALLKLAATQKAYAQKALLLELVDHLKTSNKIVAANNRQKAWLKIMEIEAVEGIESNGPGKQAMQQLNISSIRHQQEQVKSLKQGII